MEERKRRKRRKKQKKKQERDFGVEGLLIINNLVPLQASTRNPAGRAMLPPTAHPHVFLPGLPRPAPLFPFSKRLPRINKSGNQREEN